MIDISDAVAKKTVNFGRSIQGKELVEAVRAACGEDERSFHQEHRYDDGHVYVAGRKSSSPSENVLVTPTKSDPYIRADEFYDSAVVVSHDHGGGNRLAVRESPDAKIDAVLEFSGKLKAQVASQSPEQTGRERGPYAPAAGAVTKRPEGAPAARNTSPSAGADVRGY
ncbi:hypothetical protein JOF29_000589 [Kribbella aluminosa]|uniref:Uncharacterized protein n=1 Tax=Kribbella aluminosa TaxID=416017 RepID=A0ABS4UD04_9ACTN|nr:hypothetical protein [Kribbella aluminosa]MBP2349506.1 hypothetical protein [Kribbella aluminosa]